MNWSKAKNYTILFLVIVNIILASLNFIGSRRNILSQTQMDDIVNVLADNGINLVAEIPKKFKPMPTVKMDNSQFDFLALQNVFFKGMTDVKRTEEFNSVILSKGTDELRIENNIIGFKAQTNKAVENADEAKAVANDYMKNMSYLVNGGGEYRFRFIYKVEGGYSACYMQKFNNYFVFSNSMEIFVGDDGDISLELEYFPCVDFETGKNIIISADEALFGVMGEIKEDFPDGNPEITFVELGYYLVDSNGTQLTAIPHYLINVNNGETNYYVNAYSGFISK